MTWDCPEILVVDDSITDQVRTSGLIKRFVPCAKVTQASDCNAAESNLSNQAFDLVVTDLVMPERDGQDILDFIQQLPKAPAVILVTAQGNERVAAECLRRGAVAYLRKQNLAEELESALKETQTVIRENAARDRLMARVTLSCCEFEIDSDLSQIQALSSFLIQRLQSTTVMTDDHMRDVIESVREALLNAHFHGNMAANEYPFQHSRSEYAAVADQRSEDPRFADCRIRLVMNQQSDELQFVVRDGGSGFDISAVIEDSKTLGDRGNGIRKMLSSMTNVAWNSSGNEVTLTDSHSILRSVGKAEKEKTVERTTKAAS